MLLKGPLGGWAGAKKAFCRKGADLPTTTSMDMTKAKTILYVEDDPVVLMAYRQRLEKEGFLVESAKDGLEAMRILLRQVPDLVLLDLMLPRFDGGEVLKLMQANPRLKTVPVIILSTNSILDADEEYVLENASRRFIKGQCTIPMVVEAIQKLLADRPAGDSTTADNEADAKSPEKLARTIA